MPFRYRHDLLQADAAFEAEAADLNSLFADCARAMFGIMADLDSVGGGLIRSLRLEDESLDMLLHRWLSDLIFLKDKESVLFSGFDVRIIMKESLYTLESEMKGEIIDPARHSLGSDVKGVSFYRLSLKFENDLWKAFVACDL